MIFLLGNFFLFFLIPWCGLGVYSTPPSLSYTFVPYPSYHNAYSATPLHAVSNEDEVIFHKQTNSVGKCYVVEKAKSNYPSKEKFLLNYEANLGGGGGGVKSNY